MLLTHYVSSSVILWTKLYWHYASSSVIIIVNQALLTLRKPVSYSEPGFRGTCSLIRYKNKCTELKFIVKHLRGILFLFFRVCERGTKMWKCYPVLWADISHKLSILLRPSCLSLMTPSQCMPPYTIVLVGGTRTGNPWQPATATSGQPTVTHTLVEKTLTF